MTEEDPNEDKSRNAKFKLLVHEDPSNDSLMLYVDFRHVHVRLAWKDSERQDVVDLLAQGTWFLERGHLEYEVSRNSAQIDHDLQDLFPDDYEEEEE